MKKLSIAFKSILCLLALTGGINAMAFGVHYFYTGGDPSKFTTSEAWAKSPITSVIYFGLHLQPTDGTFNPLSVGRTSEFNQLKTWAHDSKPRRQMYLAVGVSASAEFLQSKASRDASAQLLVQYMKEIGADGMNMDIEYPNSRAEQAGQLAYYTELRRLLGNKTHLSVDVGPASWMSAPGGHVPAKYAINGKIHWYGLMSYGAGNANSIPFMQKFVNEYVKKGTPKSRIVVGLPFYGKTQKQGAICYKRLAPNLKPSDISSDSVTYRDESFAINSVKTIEKKVKWAKQYGLGGVMVWHWTCDSNISSPNSLTQGIANGLK